MLLYIDILSLALSNNIALLGASQAAAKRLVSNIVKVKDSMAVMERMISQASTNNESHTNASNSHKIFDISENLEDMESAYARLQAQLDRHLRTLTGHDGDAAAFFQDTISNDMQCLVFKCRAHLIRVHAKVQQAKFAAVPYERRISQSKPGM